MHMTTGAPNTHLQFALGACTRPTYHTTHSMATLCTARDRHRGWKCSIHGHVCGQGRVFMYGHNRHRTVDTHGRPRPTMSAQDHDREPPRSAVVDHHRECGRPRTAAVNVHGNVHGLSGTCPFTIIYLVGILLESACVLVYRVNKYPTCLRMLLLLWTGQAANISPGWL